MVTRRGAACSFQQTSFYDGSTHLISVLLLQRLPQIVLSGPVKHTMGKKCTSDTKKYHSTLYKIRFRWFWVLIYKVTLEVRTSAVIFTPLPLHLSVSMLHFYCGSCLPSCVWILFCANRKKGRLFLGGWGPMLVCLYDYALLFTLCAFVFAPSSIVLIFG